MNRRFPIRRLAAACAAAPLAMLTACQVVPAVGTTTTAQVLSLPARP